ncbi:SIMPL domain-containing protein [Candidatus Bathyarchaeota archaeon]|nr:SIMPL domain-containing protein [Candidatus Bathyarchaeota archaeon]
MTLQRSRLILLILAFIATSSSAMAIYYWSLSNAPKTELVSAQFPTGIPYTISASRISATETQQASNTILVSGSGTASAQADEATIILGVQTEGKIASEASRRNAELMNAVINALKSLGITEENMKTISYSIQPIYSPKNYTKIVGYRVTNMISVKVMDMNLIGAVIDAAAENGANRIRGVSFELSQEKREELVRKAYIAALKDAENKASLIAKTLGLKITGVYSVSERVYQPYQPFRYDIAAEAFKGTPIIEGKLSISVTVQVIYTFE